MTPPSLPDLPTEILLEVQALLSYGSHLALRLTCRHVYSKIDSQNRATHEPMLKPSNFPQLETAKPYSMADLLEIEQWPEYSAAQYAPTFSRQLHYRKDYFACHLCLKIRCSSNFSTAMIKGKRGKLRHGAVANKLQRFCIPCGLACGRYRWGVCFQLGGASRGFGTVCWLCGEFEQVKSRCEVPVAQRVCASCRDRYLSNIIQSPAFCVTELMQLPPSQTGAIKS